MMIIDGRLVNVAPPVPTISVEAHSVPKVTVVNRLIAAGLLKAAYAALKLDQPATALTDAEFGLRERWNAATEIASDDPDAVSLLTAVGAGQPGGGALFAATILSP